MRYSLYPMLVGNKTDKLRPSPGKRDKNKGGPGTVSPESSQ